MSDKNGMMLIGGGLLIAAITLGGYYLSQNPRALDSLLGKSDPGPDLSAFDTALTAPESCAMLPTDAFILLCDWHDKLTAPAWHQGLSTAEQSCVADAFKDYRATMLTFHRETEAVYTDADRNAAVFGFACQAIDLNERKRGNYALSPVDTQEFLDRFYHDLAVDIRENS